MNFIIRNVLKKPLSVPWCFCRWFVWYVGGSSLVQTCYSAADTCCWFILPRAIYKYRWLLLYSMIWKLNWRENNSKQMTSFHSGYIYPDLKAYKTLQLSSRPLDGDATSVWHYYYFTSLEFHFIALQNVENYRKSRLSQSERKSISWVFWRSKVESCSEWCT